ncbi:MAG: hypothetical protein J6W29_08815 [Neisseriaceae bacterium]|nr:hypothetical protein [Neisseriaceae bacterium]MBP5790316.1 hypothetical protein [Neisseriaceae bacterium]
MGFHLSYCFPLLKLFSGCLKWLVSVSDLSLTDTTVASLPVAGVANFLLFINFQAA